MKIKKETNLISIIQSYSEEKNIDNNTDLFELNISSIEISQILSQINREQSIKLTFADFMNCNTVNDLQKLILDTAPQMEQRAEKQYKKNNFKPTNVQMAYLTGRNSGFTLGGVSTHIYFEYDSDWDLSRFEEIINCEIRRQPMLRATFLAGKVHINKVEDCKYTLNVLGSKPDDFNDVLKAQKDIQKYRNFNPSKWPLFNFTAIKNSCGKSKILFDIDALISDGFSIRILFEDLVALYRGKEVNSISNKQLLNLLDTNSENVSDKSYWQNKILTLPQAPELPYSNKFSSVKKPTFSSVRKTLPLELWNKIDKKCEAERVRPTFFLLACYAATLAKWSNQKDVLINCTLFDRNNDLPNANTIIGDFTSVLLATYQRSKMFTWNSIKRFQTDFIHDYQHKDFDGIEVSKLLIKRDAKPLTDVVAPVVFTSMLFNKSDKNLSLGNVQNYATQTPQVTLDHQAMLTDDGVFLNWDYVDELFDYATISAMFNDYYGLVEGFAENKNSSLASKNALAAYQIFNDTKDISILGNSMLDRFNKSVKLYSESIAVEGQESSITYGELDFKSNQIANYLLQKIQVSKGDFVAIVGMRSIDTIIGILGILKAGAAYIPLSTEFPQSRIDEIKRDSLYKDMLTDEKINTILSGKINESVQPLPNITADDVAYAIYTSGSTGKPKGVVIKHGAAVNTINDIICKYNIKNDDVFIGLANLAFDLSVFDVFGAFSVGAKLVLCENPRNVEEVWDLVTSSNVTIWNSVPMLMEMFVTFAETKLNSEDLDFSLLPKLRLVLLSGDWIPIDLPNKITQNFMDCEVVSLGGATEASIWSIYYNVKLIDSKWKSIPYGKPLSNQTYYVLDDFYQPCPIGVTGDLYIGGKGLASGYLNNPQKTESVFINHKEFGRIYKTGDLGYLNRSGFIVFKGRNDSQVKINGFRIELEEIQNVILKMPDIISVIVVVKHQEILVYYVGSVTEASILKYAGNFLPGYMMPKYCMQLKEVPLTKNGKVNRRALPDFKESSINQNVSSDAPKNSVEEFLENTISDLLKVKNVNVTDNFFELGGNSLLIVELFNEVQKKYPNTIKLIDIFKNSNIFDLSKVILNQLEKKEAQNEK